jgi:hypothetical protein
MTEIKLCQGAKPGHGSLLPTRKVTAEIASVRQVEAHRDCLSPRGHSAFSTLVELLEFAASMRELSGGKPIGLKLCIGQPHHVMALMKAMPQTSIYPELIVVDGAEGGTGTAPLELSDWVGMPLKEGLILMQNALVGTGLRRHVKLAASGKVYSGMGLAHRCIWTVTIRTVSSNVSRFIHVWNRSKRAVALMPVIFSDRAIISQHEWYSRPPDHHHTRPLHQNVRSPSALRPRRHR